MKKNKRSREFLIETILKKLHRPKEDGSLWTTREIGAETGYSHAYVAMIASLLRSSNEDVPKKGSDFQSVLNRVKAKKEL